MKNYLLINQLLYIPRLNKEDGLFVDPEEILKDNNKQKGNNIIENKDEAKQKDFIVNIEEDIKDDLKKDEEVFDYESEYDSIDSDYIIDEYKISNK